MADEQVSPEGERGKWRGNKLMARSTGEFSAERDALIDRLNKVREKLACFEMVAVMHPCTREHVECLGKYLPAILIDQGFQSSTFVQKLLAGAETTATDASHA